MSISPCRCGCTSPLPHTVCRACVLAPEHADLSHEATSASIAGANVLSGVCSSCVDAHAPAKEASCAIWSKCDVRRDVCSDTDPMPASTSTRRASRGLIAEVICTCALRSASCTCPSALSLDSVAACTWSLSTSSSPSTRRCSCTRTCSSSWRRASSAGSCAVCTRSASALSRCNCPSTLTRRLASFWASSLVCPLARRSSSARPLSVARATSSTSSWRPSSCVKPAPPTAWRPSSTCTCRARTSASTRSRCCSSIPRRASKRSP
mmetsp:Transcript_8754/g.16611  ORF Transcript_8754/g.16611 Transcript_8754/m.16611 type:complete len:265 (+) Transcript_8754:1184-1978(+)